MNKTELARTVSAAVRSTKTLDIHTHLFAPEFGRLALWGIDELLTYHYLVCEALLHEPMPPKTFWRMSKPKRAEFIWEALFRKHTPVSEATRGVVTTLKTLGFDPREVTLKQLRKHFASLAVEEYTDTVLKKANVEAVVMTNDVLDAEEQAAWARLTGTCAGSRVGKCGRGPVRAGTCTGSPFRNSGRGSVRVPGRDPRFLAAIRVDGLLNDWKGAAATLRKRGIKVKATPDAATCTALRRFLAEQADRMRPVYLAASLPPTFAYPEKSARGTLLDKCILPFARERRLPFAVMIGVKRGVNPALQMAGDGVGRADLAALERLCERNPDNKFLATVLSRENQHELCVVARKFANLLVFGCWWFVNVPSLIDEITTMRLELLGTRFVPQHSDARVLDQLIYKWGHSRKVIADVLTRKYADLIDSGWKLTKADVQRDVADLLAGNFKAFAGL